MKIALYLHMRPRCVPGSQVRDSLCQIYQMYIPFQLCPELSCNSVVVYYYMTSIQQHCLTNVARAVLSWPIKCNMT